MRFRYQCGYILFLVLTSCSTPKCWIYREVIADCPAYSSSSLIAMKQNIYTGIEVQFLKGEFGTLGYLNVYSKNIVPVNNGTQEANVLIVVERIKHLFRGIRMEGGQRLLLPDEATCLMISALLELKQVLICLDGYSTELFSDNFPLLYARFLEKPSPI